MGRIIHQMNAISGIFNEPSQGDVVSSRSSEQIERPLLNLRRWRLLTGFPPRDAGLIDAQRMGKGKLLDAHSAAQSSKASAKQW
jgi:hypothetical protein